MPTNPNVLVDRDKYIGGSEIASILNISPFKTRWELLQEKAGIIVEKFHAVEYEEYGQKMEGKIRDFINEKYFKDDPLKEDTTIEEHAVISHRCNHDGLNSTTNWECKTTSQIHEEVREYKYYVVQLLWGMMKANKDKGLLSVYERPEDFSIEFDEKRLHNYEIKIDDFEDWIEEINAGVIQFTEDLSKLKANPFLSESDLLPEDIQSKINLVQIMEEQIKLAKIMQEKYEAEKEKLIQLMLEKGIKTFETPNKTKITLVYGKPDEEVEEEYYDESKFVLENAELWNKYHDVLELYKDTKKVIKKGRKDSLRITIPKN